MNDSELLDLIEKEEAWLTYASDLAGTEKAWRCRVSERHFAHPDGRERAARMGYGKTAREAIVECFSMKGLSQAL